MNIKLHTPKSLRSGSGMASTKQFLLSILATTVSIALTFGTAAVVDGNKKQKEKREIVMMVMYDMYNSQQTVEKADSSIRQLMDIQEKIASDTTKYDLAMITHVYELLPRVEFTQTIENIFSSNIETINTVGNVLFTENAAQFYQTRKNFKTTVCDSLYNEVTGNTSFRTASEFVDFVFLTYAVQAYSYTCDMQHLFAQCKQMMNVSDKELETYRKSRANIDKDASKKDAVVDSITNVLINQQMRVRHLIDK